MSTRESGKRTRLRFGSVSAEVSLVKASTKPREAQHETRRVLVAGDLKRSPDPEAAMRAAGAGMTEREDDPLAGTVTFSGPTVTDPFGDPAPAPSVPDPVRLDEDHFERRQAEAVGSMLAQDAADVDTFDAREPAEPWDGTNPEPRSAPDPEPDAAGGPGSRVERNAEHAAAPTYVPPATRVEQGVHLETGEWVDLTDRLAEVDERTKVDGLEVVRTIPASSYASEHVRELHYLAGVNPGEYKVLALLWRALRYERRAAEVRWTKRTAQATGIILARGELGSKSDPAYLALLELEWPANVRKPSPKATGPIRAEVRADEVAAAVDLVLSFAAPAPREELRDERLAKRGELLGYARAGRLGEYVPPAEPMPEDLAAESGGLAEALSLAAAWNREHAIA